jgi:hypothetical protein
MPLGPGYSPSIGVSGELKSGNDMPKSANVKRRIKHIVMVCVFVCHLFSFYPFYFDFHSARIIFDVSSGFYLWNINKTTA